MAGWLAAVLFLALGITSTVRADLVRYDLSGAPGDQVASAPTFSASGTTGVALARGPGLTANAGANSINAANWSTDPSDYFVLGFDLLPGFSATVNRLIFAGRSSGTGPGFISLFYRVDGGSEMFISTIQLVGTAFNNQDITFGPVTVNSNFRVLFRAANTTSANGGTIGTAGTFRLGNYSPDGGTTFVPITVGGTAAVPEPSPILLGGVAAVLAFGATRRNRKAA